MESNNLSFRKALLIVFLTSLAIWILELTLPRIYSIIFDYHYTFLSISLTLSGIGLGAAILQIWFKTSYRLETLLRVLLYTGIFSVLVLVLLVTFKNSYTNIFTLVILSIIPLITFGAVLAFIFKQYSGCSSTLYAIDLLGAVVGIGLFLFFSSTGALYILLICTLIMFIITMSLISINSFQNKIYCTLGILLVVSGIFSINTDYWQPRIALQTGNHKEMFHFEEHPGLKGKVESSNWSPFGRTDLLSSEVENDRKIFFIDGSAGSSMYRFNGDYSDTASNSIVYSLMSFPPFMGLYMIPSEQRKNALIIGPGGGRDIHLLKLAEFKDITAIEVNGDLLKIAREYNDFNGGIFTDKIDGVKVIEGEGRNYIKSSDKKYDLIFLSIPIIKSTRSPESFSLTENFLFTKEAFDDYFEKLTDNGRLLIIAHNQIEILKLTLTAEMSIKSLNSNGNIYENMYVAGVGMNPFVVFKKTPMDENEVELIHTIVMGSGNFNPEGAFFPNAEQHNAKILSSKEQSIYEPMINYELNNLAIGSYTANQLTIASDQNISPPVDNSPFFYNFQRGTPQVINLIILVAGILIMLVITLLFRYNNNEILHSTLLGSVFIAIGIGFMMIEIPLIQIFNLFLGKPIYGLTVVLVSILIGGIVGSHSSGKTKLAEKIILRISSLLIVLFTLGIIYIVPSILEFFEKEKLLLRIVVSIVILFPFGFSLSIPFPTLLRLAGKNQLDNMIPMYWSINGLASVFGAAMAIAVSINSGFSTTFLFASGFYLFVVIVLNKLR